MDAVGGNSKALDTKELFFLVAKFLDASPCQEAAKVLKRELSQHELLPPRKSWLGEERKLSYKEVEVRCGHAQSVTLQLLCTKLLTLLEEHGYQKTTGLHSLLGAGTTASVSCTQQLQKETGPVYSTMLRTALCHNELSVGFREQPVANLCQLLSARQVSPSIPKQSLCGPSFYQGLKKQCNVLGHLAPVFCVLFDQRGERIITGADDNLIKIWSSGTGQLLATLRGHSAEVGDLSLSYDNTMIASGSLDKTVRVWCAQTAAPLAVLIGHQGQVTSVQFSPSSIEECRYLTSTGKDGFLCFWQWLPDSGTFSFSPIKFMEKNRMGDQTLCSGFSPGGKYFVTGGTDRILRMYVCIPGPPVLQAELSGHTDRIMTVQFGHTGESVLATGSCDGTARVWRFEEQGWKCTLLISLSDEEISRLQCKNAQSGKPEKTQVTMVGWENTDHYLVTAFTPDCHIRVWRADNGVLIRKLEGHNGEVFVLEPHPSDSRVLLTAGHDGLVIVWDMLAGTKLVSFNLEDEESSVTCIFDGKFSPDATMCAAADSGGYLTLFGFGSSEAYSYPKEQFFHTDYHPLMQDRNHYVVDETTQLPPHLLPPPYLVDIDGNAHLARHQDAILKLFRRVERVRQDRSSDEAEDYDEYMKKHLSQIKRHTFRHVRGRTNSQETRSRVMELRPSAQYQSPKTVTNTSTAPSNSSPVIGPNATPGTSGSDIENCIAGVSMTSSNMVMDGAQTPDTCGGEERDGQTSSTVPEGVASIEHVRSSDFSEEHGHVISLENGELNVAKRTSSITKCELKDGASVMESNLSLGVAGEGTFDSEQPLLTVLTSTGHLSQLEKCTSRDKQGDSDTRATGLASPEQHTNQVDIDTRATGLASPEQHTNQDDSDTRATGLASPEQHTNQDDSDTRATGLASPEQHTDQDDSDTRATGLASPEQHTNQDDSDTRATGLASLEQHTNQDDSDTRATGLASPEQHTSQDETHKEMTNCVGISADNDPESVSSIADQTDNTTSIKLQVRDSKTRTEQKTSDCQIDSSVSLPSSYPHLSSDEQIEQNISGGTTGSLPGDGLDHSLIIDTTGCVTAPLPGDGLDLIAESSSSHYDKNKSDPLVRINFNPDPAGITNRDQPMDGDITNRDQPMDGDITNRDQPMDGDITNRDQLMDANTTNRDQPMDGYVINKDQPMDGDVINKDQPMDGDVTNRDQPMDGDVTNRDQPMDYVQREQSDHVAVQEPAGREGGPGGPVHVVEGEPVEVVDVVEGGPEGENIQNMLSSVIYTLGLNEMETKQAISLWQNRTIIRPLDSAHLGADLARRRQLYEEEEALYLVQVRRGREIAASKVLPPSSLTSPKGRSLRSGRTLPDSARPSLASEPATPSDVSSYSELLSAVDVWEDSSTDSGDISDWTTEVTSVPVVRKRSKRKQRSMMMSDDDMEEGSKEEEVQEEGQSARSHCRKKRKKEMGGANTSPQEQKGRSSSVARSESDDGTPYLPPDWIKQTTHKLSPYLPQVGDIVVYCRQGHELYLKAVQEENVFSCKNLKTPWQKYNLLAQEFCQVTNVRFSVSPPTLCSITLALLSPTVCLTEDGTSSSSQKEKITFSFKYHDMDGVLDFLILDSVYKSSVQQVWKEGDRFQSLIDGTYWRGTVLERKPFSEDLPHSYWQCCHVRWDDEATDHLSPWDMQPLDIDLSTYSQRVSATPTSSMEQEWGGEGEPDRIMQGFDAVFELDEAHMFREPVNLDSVPNYSSVVAFPTDLSTIRERLVNGIYRRKIALLWEVAQLLRNAVDFNREDSLIVEHCRVLVHMLWKFISYPEVVDPMTCYEAHPVGEVEREVIVMAPKVDYVDTNTMSLLPEPRNVSLGATQTATADTAGVACGVGDEGSKHCCVNCSCEAFELKCKDCKYCPLKLWRTEAEELVRKLCEQESASPFLEPVDTHTHKDYLLVVHTPMDLSTVRQKLLSGQYSVPNDFISDVRLIFTNAKTFNRKGSVVYKKTIETQSFFDTLVLDFLKAFPGSSLPYGTRRALGRVASTSGLEDSSRPSTRPSTSGSEVLSTASSKESKPLPRLRIRHRKSQSSDSETEVKVQHHRTQGFDSDQEVKVEDDEEERVSLDEPPLPATRRITRARSNMTTPTHSRGKTLPEDCGEFGGYKLRVRNSSQKRPLEDSGDSDNEGSLSGDEQRSEEEEEYILQLEREELPTKKSKNRTRGPRKRPRIIDSDDSEDDCGVQNGTMLTVSRSGRVLKPTNKFT